MFNKILIANRGEIAVRIIRACRNLGIRSVAVYSKEDAKSLHVQLADQRICIGEGPARNSYLNMDRIIAAAENMGADAIHPGFGFLSENSEFVRKCKENGITFIGPDADVIDKMGNKSHARKTMMDAGVPVVPGTKEPVYDAETGKKLAEEIGYPVMIKASSGGGGKGMRVAANEDEFEFQFNMAQRESANAFGDDTMYIEGIPDDKQPGVYVRRVNGKRLNDEEMIHHYTELVKKYGNQGKLKTKWILGLAIIKDGKTFTYEGITNEYYLSDKPTKERKEGYPLSSILINVKAN